MSKVVKQERWITLVKTPSNVGRPCEGCIADGADDCNELMDLYGENCGEKQFRAFATQDEAIAFLVAERLE